MTSTACTEETLAAARRESAAATANVPTILRQESAPGLPAGSWFRVIHDLPCEPLPSKQSLIPARKLTVGCRVFLDLREGSLRVRGWGIVKRLPEPLGWNVEFADGSAVGMPRAELKKHCLSSDQPATGWRRVLTTGTSRSPQRRHRASSIGK